MDWTTEQIEEMADAYFGGHLPTCPEPCGAVVDVLDNMTVAQPAAALTLSCPLCGAKAGRPRTPVGGQWTDAEVQAMRRDFHREGSATCPGDGALLDVLQSGAHVGFSCKKCGRRV